MAEDNSSRFEDDGSPRMVTLFRGDREVTAKGCADGEDAARQAAIICLQQDGGLLIGDVIQITRIRMAKV